MEELVKTIGEQTTAFLHDANLQATNGNKAAGLRARKLALEIIDNLKEFRKQSVAKANGRSQTRPSRAECSYVLVFPRGCGLGSIHNISDTL